MLFCICEEIIRIRVLYIMIILIENLKIFVFNDVN